MRDIVVIGGSAGGIEALQQIVAGLPAGLPAAVFAVIHISAEAPSLLPAILSRAGALPAIQPENGCSIEPGNIYVAPPDHHMVLREDTIRLVRGPKENRHRPAIDPLFRSAARYHGARVVGVLLSGLLDDGSGGLIAIDRCGGATIVQEPKDAQFSAMPSNALRYIKPAYSVPAGEMAPIIVRLTATPTAPEEKEMPKPRNLEIETDISEMKRWGEEGVGQIGTASSLTCPECHGTLWEVDDEKIMRYRCHTGHAFTADSLMVDQTDALEKALWIAIKTLEESAALATRLAKRAEAENRGFGKRIFSERAEEATLHAATLREMLQLFDAPAPLREPEPAMTNGH